ncbi:MAG: DUF4105 domain-containing protein [Culturomica sp.]|jgi:hypothetical protein|nr:DUF4105 domain-containing protein [Culturomica sp.]
MKPFYLLLILLCTAGTLSAQTLRLSPEASVSILTHAPGTELYSVFGHIAVRVSDPQNEIDLLFNYGTFDFRTKHFYFKFAQGLLPYQLSCMPYRDFVEGHLSDPRGIRVQVLALDSTGKQQLFDKLVENYKPANRTYLYNFLYDNCSTRIRDLIEQSVSPHSVQWNSREEHKSFWNLLDEYLVRMPWVKWGIHTILGQSGSQTATPYEYMFLPDYLMKALEGATVEGQPIVSEAYSLYETPDPATSSPWYTSPFFVFTLSALLLAGAILLTGSPALLKGSAFLLFAASGAVGVLLVFLGYFTEHPITAPNLNLIWANPLNLPVAFTLFRKTPGHIIRGYLLAYGIVLLIGFPLWFWALPAVPAASLPLLLLFALLAFRLRQQ